MMCPADLPAGIHATTLTARDPNGQLVSAFVLWADLPTNRCPRCAEPILIDTSDACPVILNGGAYAGGRVEAFDAKHGCGEWIGAKWYELADGEDVGKLAATLATWLHAEREAARALTRRRLRADLDAVLARLADGEQDVHLGSAEQPGVYPEDGRGRWIAWDYDPTGDDDSITVVQEGIER